LWTAALRSIRCWDFLDQSLLEKNKQVMAHILDCGTGCAAQDWRASPWMLVQVLENSFRGFHIEPLDYYNKYLFVLFGFDSLQEYAKMQVFHRRTGNSNDSISLFP
jgi:hypothetical protein